MMTVAPSLASNRAASKPMPDVPPVITALWSNNSIGETSYIRWGSRFAD
jgi:hypothetical protein